MRSKGSHMQVQEHKAVNHSLQIIHLNESWELNHWCEELNLRAEELKEIVKKVGTGLIDIRAYLAKRNMNREAPF